MRPNRRELAVIVISLVLILATTAVVAWPRHDRLMAQLRQLNEAGRYEQAIVLAQRYEARERRHADFMLTLGTSYLNARRYQDAADAFREVIALDARNVAASKLLAQSLCALSRQADADAIRWLAEAATCDPTNSSIFVDLGRFAQLDDLLLTSTDTAGKIVRAWAAASRAHPSLLQNSDVIRVVAQMAVIAGSDDLAEALLPVHGDELATRRVYQAQRSLAAGDRKAALAFAKEATAAAPLRQDALSLLASLGQAKAAGCTVVQERPVPDGTFVADPLRAQLYYSGLRAFDLSSGRQHTLADRVAGFAVSPDGGRIAYFATSGVTTELRVMNADGSDAGRLATVASGGDGIAWAADGRRLAFTDGDGLELINSDGSGRRLVVAADPEGSGSPHAPAWAPSGAIAYVLTLSDGSGSVAAVLPNGRSAGFTGGQVYDNPRWSADGAWLLVDAGGYDPARSRPLVIDITGRALPVSEPAGMVREAAWSRTGLRLAYIAEDPQPLDATSTNQSVPRRLWIRRWPDGAPLLVDVGAGDYSQPQWLAEGLLSFVVTQPEGGQRICIVRLK